MSGGDGVSSLNDLNEKYKQWVKNQKIEGGTTGTCNADSLYTGSNSRMADYSLCDTSSCHSMTTDEWLATWGNCQREKDNREGRNGRLKADGDNPDSTWDNHYDPCYNMVLNTTPGVAGLDLGDGSNETNRFDPYTNKLSNPGWTTGDFDHATGEYDEGPIRVHGIRAAYPLAQGESGPSSDTFIRDNIDQNAAALDDSLQSCPQNGREFICVLDGSASLTDDTPGCGWGKDSDEDGAVKFCARNSDDYNITNIANCCLGSLADGPEVDTEGNPLSTDYRSCPREFCVSRIAEGTESGSAGVNCDNPKTDKNASNVDETFCYKMSNECNTFFTEKCQGAFSDDYSGNLKQQCKDWAHIQPQEFVRIAEDVCDINSPTNDYVDERARPSSTDLRHVKSVLNRPLCREYITSTEHYPTESQKLKNLCKHYMKEQDDGSWEAQKSLDHDNVLENICGCHYPSGYYTWYNRRYETREAGTCEDSEGNPLSAISRSECESGTPPGTWTPDAGAASITAALSDMMKGHPQCYYDKCISSMLYDVHNDAIPCAQNLQFCYQQMTQNNVMVGQDGNLSELPDMSALTGRAQQTCNQSTLSSPPPPSSDVGGDNDDSGGFLSGIFGGSDDGTVSDGSDNTNMIILIVVILLIVIIGVVVVVVLNKGKSTPQEIVVQQPLAA